VHGKSPPDKSSTQEDFRGAPPKLVEVWRRSRETAVKELHGDLCRAGRVRTLLAGNVDWFKEVWSQDIDTA
jgi:hypothetical protein